MQRKKIENSRKNKINTLRWARVWSSGDQFVPHLPQPLLSPLWSWYMMIWERLGSCKVLPTLPQWLSKVWKATWMAGQPVEWPPPLGPLRASPPMHCYWPLPPNAGADSHQTCGKEPHDWTWFFKVFQIAGTYSTFTTWEKKLTLQTNF